MTIKVDPPGRTSVSTTGVVQGSGANHCLSKAGSVHALNTLSRGASMIDTRENEVAAFGGGGCVRGHACSFRVFALGLLRVIGVLQALFMMSKIDIKNAVTPLHLESLVFGRVPLKASHDCPPFLGA